MHRFIRKIPILSSRSAAIRYTACTISMCVLAAIPAPVQPAAAARARSALQTGYTAAEPAVPSASGARQSVNGYPEAVDKGLADSEKVSSAQAQAPPRKREYYEQRGEIVWEVPSAGQVIALTFDDGPDPVQTAQILNELKKYGAKATFFAVGKRAERFPELIKREIAEGHEVGNHTYSHPFLTSNRTTDDIRGEITATQKVLKSITGKSPTLFRPPGGYYHERLVHASLSEGCLPVLWSWHQDTEDWKSPPVSKIVNKVLNNAREGDIVLFHDYVKGSANTVAAIKQILPELQKRGYRFVTVSELITLRGSTSGVSKHANPK
ncbi:polysaccharide deacetylase family protein [Paenibacillus sp. FJAT-26967]|uniref:polysaccharide deacetylase family protein n=1 Tax=Paenibacillus sp. FJAT-26967 TaxID=1729690 RepID=UPI0008382915|nr:polysaccharide deacetylase family protein [Paenibacillus sp. FJAT-26967]